LALLRRYLLKKNTSEVRTWPATVRLYTYIIIEPYNLKYHHITTETAYVDVCFVSAPTIKVNSFKIYGRNKNLMLNDDRKICVKYASKIRIYYELKY